MGRKILILKHILIISNSSIILIVDLRTFEVKILKVPVTAKSELQKDCISNGRCNVGSTYIGISSDSKYLAAVTENKMVIIWNTENWEIQKVEYLLKRPVGVVFSQDSENVLVADKTGDVYSFCVSDNDAQQGNAEEQSQNFGENYYTPDEEAGPEPLLGHLSMLLDLVISYDGKFLITCDRDEKIRVSCYPNSYSIHTFCLGHEEFVSYIQLVPNCEHLLLSCSGDGTVRLWNYHNGTCLVYLDTWPEIENFKQKGTLNTNKSGEVEKKHLTAITKLDLFKLNEFECILVILLNRLPILLFYTLNLKNMKFTYFSKYETTRLPLDIIFLPTGELLVINDVESFDLNPLQLLNICMDSQMPNRICAISTHPILEIGSQHKDLLKVDNSCLSDIELLYKQRYDNVADYKKRKEERLGQRLTPDVSKKELNSSEAFRLQLKTS